MVVYFYCNNYGVKLSIVVVKIAETSAVVVTLCLCTSSGLNRVSKMYNLEEFFLPLSFLSFTVDSGSSTKFGELAGTFKPLNVCLLFASTFISAK